MKIFRIYGARSAEPPTRSLCSADNDDTSGKRKKRSLVSIVAAAAIELTDARYEQETST